MEKLTLADIVGSDLPIISQLYSLIDLSISTKRPIDESVVKKFRETDSAAIVIWAIKYKKCRVLDLEPFLASNEDNNHYIMPYLAHFPETKDGPLWEKITTDAESAVRYAQVILKDRFIEGEEAIIKSEYNSIYVEFLKDLRGLD